MLGWGLPSALLHGVAPAEVRVVEYAIFPFPPELEDHRAQIGRVERLSDADHPRAGDRDLLVAYLLEIRRRP